MAIKMYSSKSFTITTMFMWNVCINPLQSMTTEHVTGELGNCGAADQRLSFSKPKLCLRGPGQELASGDGLYRGWRCRTFPRGALVLMGVWELRVGPSPLEGPEECSGSPACRCVWRVEPWTCSSPLEAYSQWGKQKSMDHYDTAVQSYSSFKPIVIT